MFKASTIIEAPSGRFIFVGRVHEMLRDTSYDTISDATRAAVDCMLSIGETFPVAVSAGGAVLPLTLNGWPLTPGQNHQFKTPEQPRPAKQLDIFDNGCASQPGERQIDLEDLIEEKKQEQSC
jgi:hypothetical protein